MHAQERAIRTRVAQRRCRECDSAYTPDGVTVLARRGTTWVILLVCISCRHQRIFVATFKRRPRFPDADLSSPAALPEPTITLLPLPRALAVPPTSDIPETASPGLLDVPPFDVPPPITTYDVADIHTFLAAFDGDFKRLFGGDEG